MKYADFEYYSNVYGKGNPVIPADLRETYLEKAESYLNAILGANKPGEPYEENIKTACCEMADCIYVCAERDGISSENNDGYSVTYDTRHSINNKAYAIALRHLSGTGLLYRGLG